MLAESFCPLCYFCPLSLLQFAPRIRAHFKGCFRIWSNLRRSTKDRGIRPPRLFRDSKHSSNTLLAVPDRDRWFSEFNICGRAQTRQMGIFKVRHLAQMDIFRLQAGAIIQALCQAHFLPQTRTIRQRSRQPICRISRRMPIRRQTIIFQQITFNSTINKIALHNQIIRHKMATS